MLGFSLRVRSLSSLSRIDRERLSKGSLWPLFFFGAAVSEVVEGVLFDADDPVFRISEASVWDETPA